MNILLVEDDDGVRAYVSAMLEQAGHEVTAVADGDEALQIYRGGQSTYHLVLTDRWHPGMDGIELAATIRGINPSQPIAFQTAGEGDSVVKQRMERYALTDLPRILKPYKAEQLLRFIQSVIAPTIH